MMHAQYTGVVADNQPNQQLQQPGGQPFSPLTASLHGQRSRSSLGGSSPRGSRESLLTPGEEQQQLQQQQLNQPDCSPWLQQHDPEQQQQHQQQMEQLQQQSGHAAAFVSLLPVAGGGSGSMLHAPRSPSRLRYIRKDSSSAGATGLQATAPHAKLPEFLEVQELPPGILREVCCSAASNNGGAVACGGMLQQSQSHGHSCAAVPDQEACLHGRKRPATSACLQDEVEIVHQEGNEAVRAADVEDKIIRQVDELVAYFNGLFEDGQLDIR